MAVGYVSNGRCTYGCLTVIGARTSKKNEKSGAVGNSNDLLSDYNELNFATQLQQLISGTVIDKTQWNKGQNSQSELAKARLQENLKEIQAVHEKMKLDGKYESINLETAGKISMGKYLSEYSDTRGSKEPPQGYNSNSKASSEAALGVLLAKDFAEQVALADENGEQLDLGWKPESIGRLADTAKLARERLLKSLEEGPPEYIGPMCPRCNNAAEEDDLAYFGVCTLCRQLELTEEHYTNTKNMNSNNKFTYSSRSVKDGAASPSKWSSNYSQIKVDQQKQAGNTPGSDIPDASIISSSRDVPVKSLQIKSNVPSMSVDQMTHISERVESDANSQWPSINENGFKTVSSDIDSGPYCADDYSSEGAPEGLEDRVINLEYQFSFEIENFSSVVSRLDRVIALVEKLEVQIESSRDLIEEQDKIIKQQRGEIAEMAKYVKDAMKSIAPKCNTELPEYKNKKK